MTTGSYSPCLLVRWLSPRLPRAWQERIAEGASDRKRVSRIFEIAIGLICGIFALCVFALSWCWPFATPIWFLGSLTLAWWGYKELGLSSPSSGHRHWVIKQIATTQDNENIDNYAVMDSNRRWELDLWLVYARPQSRSELEHLWLGAETIPVEQIASPRARL